MINCDPLELVQHIVGNNVAHGKNYHQGTPPHRTAQEVRDIQTRVIQNLETQINDKQITDQGALNILTQLKNSDWADEQSYTSFRTAYDTYVAPRAEEVKKERDRLRQII